MNWPQIVVLFLFALNIISHVSNHGKTRTYNGPVAFIDAAIFAWLLWMGGFFA